MKKPNRKLKLYAREAFQLKPAMCVISSLVVVLIRLAASFIAGALFPGTGVMNIILGEVFAFGLTVLTCLFEAGLHYMFLNLSRGKETDYGQLLWFFRNEPDRVILASTVLALIAWLTNLPFTITNYTAPVPKTETELVNYFLMLSVLNFAGLIVGVLLTIPLRLTYYILADEPEAGSIDALKKSCSLMKGNYGRFLLLQLSFWPWIIISMFMLYFPLLYVLPYMELSNVALYRDIRGEYILYHPPVATDNMIEG